MRSRWMRAMVMAGLLAGVSAAVMAAPADLSTAASAQVDSSAAASAQVAQPPRKVGGESGLILPDLSAVLFRGVDGHSLLLAASNPAAAGIHDSPTPAPSSQAPTDLATPSATMKLAQRPAVRASV